MQEIDNEDYNPASDSLPNDYSDKTVGHRYYYNTAGDLAGEINKYNIETTYDYSSAGTLEHKSFDMYDYYYLIDGRYDKVLVNGETIVDYDYNADTAGEPEEGQYADTVSYANGDFDETVYYDNGAVCKKFTNHSEKPYYSLGTDINKKTSYHNQETRHSYHVNQNDGITTYEKNRAVTASGCYLAWNYKTYTENDVTTVVETYFNSHNHKTVYSEDAVKYISENANLTYTADSGENNTAVEKISNGDTTVLSTAISYDEDTKTYSKSYAGKDYTFRNVYDDNGYISSDDISSYEYDKYGELIKTTGRQNASYTYDGRGNILTKTVDSETTSFAYDSPWKDQLTAVNDKAITYDANGNMLTYGDVQYSWTHGKMLSEITDGENTYEYKYDTNGIRGEKVINGQRTIINSLNGTVFSQHDIDNNNVMYFQYSAGTPLGFQLNDVQYLYITNLSGDVVGITDLDGNVLAEYAYDEWGKLLEITADNAENKALAELNPLRYRGYYYDNETGMYYLQSRYYSPDLCRFISADDFDYVDNYNQLLVNAYIYCVNNPINCRDTSGNGVEHDLSDKNWHYRIDSPNPQKHEQRHIHIYKGKGNDIDYSQNEDGSRHKKSSKGSPTNSQKKEVKKKSGWDWDAKEKAYNKEKDKVKEKNRKDDITIEINAENVVEVVIYSLFIALLLEFGGFLLIFIWNLLPTPIKVPV